VLGLRLLRTPLRLRLAGRRLLRPLLEIRQPLLPPLALSLVRLLHLLCHCKLRLQPLRFRHALPCDLLLPLEALL